MSFAVFLSHSSADKPAVEELARRLARKGIQAWLDRWNLIPGEPFQPAIEKALAESETCAVFVGPSGFGPWQNEEMRAAIDRRVRASDRRFRVIPVLLPGAERGERSSLPTFLAATTWVEFRDSLDDANAFHRLVCGIRGMEPGAGPGQALYQGQCPYRGLRAFDVGDSPFFFGREALVQWLLNAVRPAPEGRIVNRFLAILGASGSGKSSLARAGLIAALNRDAIPGSSGCPVAILRPGPDPLESLAMALSRTLNVAQSASAMTQLIEDFQNSEKTLHLIARQSLPENAADQRLVVLVDQFEEIFTLCTNDQLRAALTRNLLYAAKVTQGQTLVILTMRADFYAKCATHTELAAAFSDHNFLVGPMTDNELRRAIERPAQLVGCEFDAGLVDLLLQDIRNQPGALPLLQHALLELWNKREGRRLTANAYEEIGKLEGALQRRADATFQAFSESEKELCRRTFLRLTLPGEGTEDTKRRAPMRELLSLARTSGVEEAVIQRLVNDLLLTADGDISQKDAFVEVAHEALIRSWPQLRKWIDADRAGLLTRVRLTEATREWKTNRREAAYLYTGVRLAVAEEWKLAHPTELNADEAEFLRCSRDAQELREATELEAARKLVDAQRERAEQAEKAQQLEKERAELAEKRAEEQKEFAGRLRRRAFWVAGAAGIAVILLAVSVFMWRAAEEQAKIATAQHAAADDLVYLIQEDVANEAARLGYGMLVGEIYKKLCDHYHAHQPDERDEGALIKYARVLENYADFLRARGQLKEAYISCLQSFDIRKRVTGSAGRLNDLAWQRDREQDLARSLDTQGDIFVAQGRNPEALNLYRAALDMRQNLAKRNPDIHDPTNAQLRIDLSNSLEHIGEILEAQDNLVEAYSDFSQSAENLRVLLESSGVSKKQQEAAEAARASSIDMLGSVRKAEGKYKEALEFYLQSFDILKKLVKSDDQNAPLQEKLASSYEHIGEVLRLQQQFPEALNHYSESVNILQTLAERDPGDVQRKYQLSLGTERRGDVRFNLGKHLAALDDFTKSFGDLQALANSNPENLQWQHDLSIVLEKLGDTCEEVRRPHEAEERFKSSLEIRRQLVERNPNDSRREQDLSSGLDRLGNISKEQKNFDQALTYYRESRNIREKFAGQYPEDGVWQTYLAFSYEHIGDVLDKQKKLSEALQEFRKAFTIRKKLADAFQEDAERQARVAHLCLSIALTLDNTKSNEKEEAIRLLAQGREILEGLSKKNALSASQQEDLSKLQSLAWSRKQGRTQTRRGLAGGR